MFAHKQDESRRDARLNPLVQRLVRALQGRGGRGDIRLLRSFQKRRQRLSRDQRRALEQAESQAGEPIRFVAHRDTMTRPVNTNVETT